MDQTTTDKASEASAATALLDEAKTAAGKVVNTATEQIERRLDSEKNKAAEAIGGVADAIRSTAEVASETGPAGALGARAADGIEDVADYLQSRSLRDVIGEVEGFARREPAIFLGAAFALGLVGGRFLKSSARSRADARHAAGSGSIDHSRTLMSRAAALEPVAPAGASRSADGGRQLHDTHEGRGASASRGAPSTGHTDVPRPGASVAAANAAAAASAASASAGNAGYKPAGAEGVTSAQASAAGSANMPPAQGAEAKKAGPAAPGTSNGEKSRTDGATRSPRSGGESRS